MNTTTYMKDALRKKLFTLLLSFICTFAFSEEYVFTTLYDPNFKEISADNTLRKNLKGRTYYLLFSKDFYGQSIISMLINGSQNGVYTYDYYDNGWYIYKYCMPYTNSCAYLYVYKDKSTIRFSGLFDGGYWSEATLIPERDRRQPSW